MRRNGADPSTQRGCLQMCSVGVDKNGSSLLKKAYMVFPHLSGEGCWILCQLPCSSFAPPPSPGPPVTTGRPAAGHG